MVKYKSHLDIRKKRALIIAALQLIYNVEVAYFIIIYLSILFTDQYHHVPGNVHNICTCSSSSQASIYNREQKISFHGDSIILNTLALK